MRMAILFLIKNIFKSKKERILIISGLILALVFVVSIWFFGVKKALIPKIEISYNLI